MIIVKNFGKKEYCAEKIIYFNQMSQKKTWKFYKGEEVICIFKSYIGNVVLLSGSFDIIKFLCFVFQQLCAHFIIAVCFIYFFYLYFKKKVLGLYFVRYWKLLNNKLQKEEDEHQQLIFAPLWLLCMQ